MALTAQQLSDLRADIGDAATAFSDDELNRNWDRVDGAGNDTMRHEATLYLCYRQIVAGSVKLHDYDEGQTSEKLSQVFTHAKVMLDLYKKSYDLATGQRKLIAIGSLRPTGNPNRTTPTDDDMDSLRRVNPNA